MGTEISDGGHPLPEWRCDDRVCRAGRIATLAGPWLVLAIAGVLIALIGMDAGARQFASAAASGVTWLTCILVAVIR